MPLLTLLLPRDVAAAGASGPAFERLRSRAVSLPPLDASPLGLVEGLFEWLPKRPGLAGIAAEELGDSRRDAQWLRADPAWIRPDLGGARLLAYGPALELDRDAADALAQPLRPLFGDEGFELHLAAPERWYLRLPKEAKLPVFARPDQALGENPVSHLPAEAEGRRWRRLLNEAQMLLHQHPLNAQRLARGLSPVNSVWFWGEGPALDSASARVASVRTDDAVLTGLARRAGLRGGSAPASLAGEIASEPALVDLRDHRAALEACAFAPVLAALRGGPLDRAEFRLEDGRRWAIARGDLWKFWRRGLRI